MISPPNGIEFYRAFMDLHEDARRAGARRRRPRRRVRRALGVQLVNAGRRLIDGPGTDTPRIGVERS